MARVAWLAGLVLLVGGCATAPPPGGTLLSYGGQEGGLQFLISPADAEVWVDAEYMGKVSDFQGENVLWLPRGLHAVEVRRDGHYTFFRQVQITLGLVEVMITNLHSDNEGPFKGRSPAVRTIQKKR